MLVAKLNIHAPLVGIELSMDIVSYFDRIYVVNLPTRADRLQSIKKEFKRVGIDIPNPKIQIFSAVRPDEPAGFPEIGWRGCFLSHLEIIKSAKNDNLSKILILEDDCLISSRLAKTQNGLIKELASQKWGFAYLGHAVALKPEPTSGQFVPFSGEVLTTHCYAISGEIFGRTIEYLQDYALKVSRQRPVVDHGIDGVISLFRASNPDIVTLLASPSLANQSESASDIFHDNGDVGLNATASVKRFLRQMPLGNKAIEVVQSAKRFFLNR